MIINETLISAFCVSNVNICLKSRKAATFWDAESSVGELGQRLLNFISPWPISSLLKLFSIWDVTSLWTEIAWQLKKKIISFLKSDRLSFALSFLSPASLRSSEASVSAGPRAPHLCHLQQAVQEQLQPAAAPVGPHWGTHEGQGQRAGGGGKGGSSRPGGGGCPVGDGGGGRREGGEAHCSPLPAAPLRASPSRPSRPAGGGPAASPV